MNSYRELKDTLQLNTNKPTQTDLEKLKTWCFEHVSQDRTFSGTTIKIQFDQYEKFVKNYLDTFIANLPRNLSHEIDALKKTPIQYAALQGYDRFIAAETDLLETVNQKTGHGMTPLHLAAVKGYPETVKSLLDLGADASALNQSHQPPVFSALALPILHDEDLLKNKEKIFDLLRKSAPKSLNHFDNTNSSVIHYMAVHGFHDLLEDLIKIDYNLVCDEKNGLLWQKNNQGHYPIHVAILNGQVDVVKTLMEINPVSTLVDNKKRAPIHYAALYGKDKIIDLCIHHTENINCLDGEHHTPFLLAVSSMMLENMKIIASDNDAKLAIPDIYGSNALHHAVLTQNPTIVEWVLKNTKIDVNQPNHDKQTPLSLAEKHDLPDIKNILLEHGAQLPLGLNHS